MHPDGGSGIVDQLVIIEETISNLAIVFDVSKLSRKIRMVELGYKIAIGALNYENQLLKECWDLLVHNLV